MHASPSATAHPSPQATPAPLFADDFTGPRLDGGRWDTCYLWSRGPGCTNNGNNELEWYLPEQASVQDGTLELTALRVPTQGTDGQGRPKTYSFRSGMVANGRHFRFTYGYLEFRVRASDGAGLWPAVWLLPSDLLPTPEIDVMEAWGNWPGVANFFYHAASGPGAQKGAQVDIREWHTYGLDWTPDSLTWYVDGQPLFATNNPPHQPMYLLATLAVDGGKVDSTTPSTGTLELAHVRVWASRPPSPS